MCEQIFILNATKMRTYIQSFYLADLNMKLCLVQLSIVKCFVSTRLRTYFLQIILLRARHFELLFGRKFPFTFFCNYVLLYVQGTYERLRLGMVNKLFTSLNVHK